ncbi:MAG: aminodeoxychorismate/anthranilate synthase component II [Oscillospiraceae bacterium]|nr:aminodeoxychorismate/anthranilate synthase component II [Oscillospiraceae bacterium]
MFLLIDNYDSFSYNLYQYIGEILQGDSSGSDNPNTPNLKVIRNDELTVEQIEELNPQKIVISPGPGKPADAGCCVEVVRKLYAKIPILGICLGHQAIFEAFGGTVSYAKALMHGKSSLIEFESECPLFAGKIPKFSKNSNSGEAHTLIQVARYHSLAGIYETLPADLKVIAKAECGEIMGVSHKEHHVYGLQFHPESILTEGGFEMLKNFCELV